MSIRGLLQNAVNTEFHIFGKFESDASKRIHELTNKSHVANLMHVIRKENISVLHMFDGFYLNVAKAVVESFPNIKIVVSFALSQYQRIVNIVDFFKYIAPELSERVASQTETIELFRKMDEESVNIAHHVVYVSEYYRRMIHASNAVFNDAASVILNGMDFESPREPKDAFSWPKECSPSAKKVLFIGRFDMMKNISFLLDTSLPEGLELIVAGGGNASSDGNMDSIVEMLGGAQKPNNVHYVGFAKGRHKNWLLQQCDAVIVPSIHEPFGIVCLEAIAARTVLICSRASGMAEFVKQDMCIPCGLIPLTIRRALDRLICMSEKEREEMLQRAHEGVKHLTWQKNAEAYEKVYSSVING